MCHSNETPDRNTLIAAVRHLIPATARIGTRRGIPHVTTASSWIQRVCRVGSTRRKIAPRSLRETPLSRAAQQTTRNACKPPTPRHVFSPPFTIDRALWRYIKAIRPLYRHISPKQPHTAAFALWTMKYSPGIIGASTRQLLCVAVHSLPLIIRQVKILLNSKLPLDNG